MLVTESRLHVRVHREDGAFWATVDEYPGVLATGDDLEELRGILEEGICLMVAQPEGKVPNLRVSPLEVEPAGSLASAILIAA
jgi:predicted RNase H-like HicB family nuclease